MASNISVAITVDNKQYIAGINAADNATKKFGQNASKSINDVNLVSNNLISRIGGLKTALAGLVSATAIQSANNFANAIKDISVTTDLSIESVLGLSRAFELNGGTAEGAQNAILKFADTIAQARNGNDAAMKSFKEVGISVNDLNKNGIEELAKRSIAGIAGLSSATAQIRTQTDLFGKTARSVSFGGVQQTQQGQVISPESVAALKSGADASENMKKQFSQLTEALLRVAQPLNDIVKSINVSVSAFESLIRAILAAVAAFALFKGIGLINGLLGGLSAAATATGGVLAFFAKQFVIIAGSIKYFILNLGRAIGLLPTAFGGLTSVGFALGALAKGFLRFAGVAGIIYTVIQAIEFLSKLIFNFSPLDFIINQFDKLADVAKKFFNIKPDAPDQSDAETKRLSGQNAMLVQLEKDKKAKEEADAATKAYQERLGKLASEIRKVSDNLAFNNDQQLESLALDTRLIGKKEDEIELARALSDVYKKEKDTIKDLLETRRQYAQGTEDQKAAIGFIDKEIAKVKELTSTQAKNIGEYIERLQTARMLEKNRQQELKNIIDLMEEMSKAQEEIAGFQSQQGAAKVQAFEQLDAQKQSFDLLMRREELERGILNLREQDKTAATQLFDLENERKKQLEEIQKIQNLPFEGVGGMKQRMEEINKLYDDRLARIQETQARTTEEQNSFSFGWAQATEKYRNSITTNAEYAGKTMQNFTKGIEDVFVKFVQTGKLSFKDLANSMIADFARIQAQKALTGLFGGGDILGGIGKIFGFANGGMPPVGVPSIVGERGPELFVPQSAGRIIPNNALGGGSSVVNNTTEVTYSIQAMDASSFRSMLARDPEFIHNVAEQGRRSLPIRSRR
jgi:lambda family phage tail tape measure protein